MSIIDKANTLLEFGRFNKTSLSDELGISRPTLNSRLSGESDWKKLESKWIKTLYDKWKAST